jgi:hypothetical protein
LELSLVNQLKLGISSKAFGVFMRYLIRVLAVLMIFIIGRWQYYSSSPPPKWSDFVGGMMMAAPFSLGLWLSSFQFGKKYKIITLILMLPSALIHWMFADEVFSWFFVVVLFIEAYAVYSLFAQEGLR